MCGWCINEKSRKLVILCYKTCAYCIHWHDCTHLPCFLGHQLYVQESRIKVTHICICAVGNGSVGSALCGSTVLGITFAQLKIQKNVCGVG